MVTGSLKAKQEAMRTQQPRHPGPIAAVPDPDVQWEITRRALIAAQLTCRSPEWVASHYNVPLARLQAWINAGMPLGPLSKAFAFNAPEGVSEQGVESAFPPASNTVDERKTQDIRT
jgi:hypothetical protein